VTVAAARQRPDQIISSNAYGVAAICAEAGATVLDLGIAGDNIEAITAWSPRRSMRRPTSLSRSAALLLAITIWSTKR
jgi:hypothetical protein